MTKRSFSIPNAFPVDTERKLNVHDTFRRRPVRSIHVLCLWGYSCNSSFIKIADIYQFKVNLENIRNMFEITIKTPERTNSIWNFQC